MLQKRKHITTNGTKKEKNNCKKCYQKEDCKKQLQNYTEVQQTFLLSISPCFKIRFLSTNRWYSLFFSCTASLVLLSSSPSLLTHMIQDKHYFSHAPPSNSNRTSSTCKISVEIRKYFILHYNKILPYLTKSQQTNDDKKLSIKERTIKGKAWCKEIKLETSRQHSNLGLSATQL